MFTKNQWLGFNQTCIDYGHITLTSRRDDKILVIFDFFIPVLKDFINISKFKYNDTSRCKCTGWGFKGGENGLVETFVFLWKTLLLLHEMKLSHAVIDKRNREKTWRITLRRIYHGKLEVLRTNMIHHIFKKIVSMICNF